MQTYWSCYNYQKGHSAQWDWEPYWADSSCFRSISLSLSLSHTHTHTHLFLYACFAEALLMRTSIDTLWDLTKILEYDANLNRHALRPNKNIGIFDPTFIIEMRTKGISITPWPSGYNWITNQRYKVWTLQGKSLISSQFLKNQKKSKASPFLIFIQ